GYRGMMSVEIYNALKECVSEKNVIKDKPLKEHTYTRLGGSADYFVTPETYEEVQSVIQYAQEKEVPFMLLGNGSNIIIRDGGIRGIVMYLGKLATIRHTDTTVIAQSGALIANVSSYALENKLAGMEFACGIPGSVGGALFMNAGAYGGEVKDILSRALILTRAGEMSYLAAEDLDLSYRTSNIPAKRYIVLEAEFQLEAGEHAAIKAIMDDLT